jgi:hypothetical protein
MTFLDSINVLIERLNADKEKLDSDFDIANSTSTGEQRRFNLAPLIQRKEALEIRENEINFRQGILNSNVDIDTLISQAQTQLNQLKNALIPIGVCTSNCSDAFQIENNSKAIANIKTNEAINVTENRIENLQLFQSEIRNEQVLNSDIIDDNTAPGDSLGLGDNPATSQSSGLNPLILIAAGALFL